MNSKHLAIAAAALLLLLAHFFRYEIVVSAGPSYRLDRWTGEVTFILGNTEEAVKSKDEHKKRAPLAKWRERHPQYASRSDLDVAKALHGKYCGEMPWKDFAALAGIESY